jgi:hypothetical protein
VPRSMSLPLAIIVGLAAILVPAFAVARPPAGLGLTAFPHVESGAASRRSALLLGVATEYLYTSSKFFHDNTNNVYAQAFNPTSAAITVVIHATNDDGSEQGGSPSTLVVQPGTTGTQGILNPNFNGYTIIEVESPVSEIHPSVDIFAGSTVETINDGDFKVTRRSCALFTCTYVSTDSAIFNASDQSQSANATASAMSTTIGGALNGLAGTVKGRLGPDGVGFFTDAFCAEGSVRNDANGVLQMYVTIFSKTPQTVHISYITNKGTFGHDVALQAGVRYTDDANNFLVHPNGALAGQTDVDTSVEVTAPSPVFLACPVYFSRSIGDAGHVAGGTVQDGSHN